MIYKKGDMVRHWTDSHWVGKRRSSKRGVVVEVRDKYESESTNHPPPLFRVRWATQHQTEWYYEEDICLVNEI